MMLIDRDAIETKLIGEFKLIEIFVIEIGALFWIVIAVRIGHP